MKEKLAIFMPALRGGGAEKMMLHLAETFVDRGLIVDLVVTKAVGAYLDRIPDGVSLVDLGVSRVVKSLPGLIRYVREARPTIMFSTLNQANLIAIIAKKMTRHPMRLVVREATPLRASLKDLPLLKRFATPLLMRWFYPEVDAVIAISNGVAGDLRSLGTIPAEKLHVIYNPVISQNVLELYGQANDHSWFQCPDSPLVLAVGRLAAEKDFLTLVKAFRIVRNQRDARLVILGEGQERSKIEALVRSLRLTNDVDMPGFVVNPYTYMARASVLVSSSIWEGFGNVIVEAMVAGTPVIATMCPGGPAEILDDGKFGPLVPVGRPDLLAQAIVETLDSPLSRDVLVRRGMDFSTAVAADKYLDVLLVAS